MSTYLGTKGYTIYKECLDPKELRKIREELNIRPKIHNSPVQPQPFKIYTETKSLIHVPRYYGIDLYGPPEEVRNNKYTKINIEFTGELRKYQLDIAELFIDKAGTGGGGLLEIPCGRGKTVIALNIISRLCVKTMVIVHKGFLMSQWTERIQQFIPGARIGKIQGPHIDIEDKDIVLVMLQSASMRDYPDGIFNSFGLMVVDECHHISSEVFSRSLTKIATTYSLGLSATMERKDGLTSVIKMFLGEVLYKETREGDNSVIVKGIRYTTDDDEFNDVILDYKGNPQYSPMISKICSSEPRTEFIVNTIEKEMMEYPDQHVLVLGHNKNMLVAINDIVSARGTFTSGFYLGGMKEDALKESETKQIVIATYAMAAEALDIKSLTTLVLASPKTDVVQCVGRILRTKHDRPLVIDIIDPHDMFGRQWIKRRAYYRKNKYNIRETGKEKPDIKQHEHVGKCIINL
jgi:superfamily II DNA or RNA helicase